MYTETEARELVLEAGLKLSENKLIARTWGNISARISKTQFVITPSGRTYDTLTVDDLVVVNISDQSYEGDIKPSSEKGAHAVCYKLRPDCDFVIHTHQFYASAMAADEQDMTFAPCAKYGLPGTKKLTNNIRKCIKENKDYKTFLLAKHGTLILGDTYEEAFELAEQLEKDCEKQYNRRVPSFDIERYEKIDLDEIKVEGMPCVVLQQDSHISECCIAGLKLKSYVDDYAQIVGPDAMCVHNDPQEIMKALKDRNACLVKGVGAVCVGVDELDAEAVAMIMSKNCASACYARKAGPMSFVDASLQRKVYLSSYSKRKDA